MWKSLDVLTLKSKDHIQVRTLSGGLVSAASLMIMVWLLISEFSYFRSTKLEEHLMVDTSQGDRNMEITLELDLLAIPCKQADLRVEDSKGMAYEDARVHLTKTAIVSDGRVAVGVGIHPDAAPGCKLKGSLSVRKVAGNFHVAAGTAFGMGDGHFAYSVSPLDFASYNASHILRHLDFGPYFPTSYNQWAPLDGAVGRAEKAGTQFQYHLKVVPTSYQYLNGRIVDSQQFSSTDFTHAPEMSEGVLMQPGVWFRYDFSPIMVRLVETRASFLYFLTSVCAILGGVFALSGIADTLLHRAQEAAKNK